MTRLELIRALRPHLVAMKSSITKLQNDEPDFYVPWLIGRLSTDDNFAYMTLVNDWRSFSEIVSEVMAEATICMKSPDCTSVSYTRDCTIQFNFVDPLGPLGGSKIVIGLSMRELIKLLNADLPVEEVADRCLVVQ